MIMAYCHVAHDCILGSNIILANMVEMGGHVEIGDHVVIGGGTVIHQFCQVGEHAMIGAGYRITQDVIPFSKVAGYPVKFLGLNTVGLKRRGFDDDVLFNLKTAFRILLSKKLNTTQALAKIEQEIEMIPEIKRVIDFIRSSERGVIKS